ncbi:MAG: 50S ribosomal protein L25 [Vallitaleaceae bacterium]|nr:50S ribosomal protein L25 [Vallitaleaceae bacterium]
MGEIILEAIDRMNKTEKEKGKDFIKGVIYGDNMEKAISVSFNRISLRKVISEHGSNAKVWINHHGVQKYGYIKDVQRVPMSNEIRHIDVQLVSVDHAVKMLIPIRFVGEDSLKVRQLQLQIHKNDISVQGKMDIIPESISVDVSEMILGDTITIEQLNLDSNLQIDNEHEIYAMVAHQKVVAAEVIEEAATEARMPSLQAVSAIQGKN